MSTTAGRLLAACALTLAASLGTPRGARAQVDPGREDQGAGRPRVALVLGGGGARGFAHVGVLRALHDARIPVDAVVGTSAGALVGGLYASGMPLVEIERLFESRDWPELFDDAPPRPLTPVRHKREERELLIGFEIGIGLDGVRLPPGLIGGGELLTLLQSETLHTRGLPLFDAYPLPFRAIATDLSTGERVILDRGSLALAIRASLSVPGIFAPVEVAGRRLVDGGLVDNLPVGVARDLGADVIIAVDVGSTLDVEPGETAIQIADRALTIMIRQATSDAIDRLGDRDWLVVPELGDIRSRSFTSSAYRRAVRAGLEAVETLRNRWPELQIDEEDFAVREAARTGVWRAGRRLEVDFVRADASRTALDEEVVVRMFAQAPGTGLDAQAFRRRMSEMLGYGGFSSVEMEVDREGNRVGITLLPVDQPWGPSLVQSGLLLSDRQRGRALWTLRAHLLHGRINGLGGELRVRAHLGSEQLLGAEWYQPLHAAQRLFGSIMAELRRDDDLVGAPGGGLESLDLEEIAGELAAGARLGSWGEARVGLRLSRLDAERATGDDGALPEATDIAAWFARLEVDVLDRAAFPSRGLLLRSELRLARRILVGDEAFDRAHAGGLVAASKGWHTVLLGAEIGTALGDTLRVGRDFQLGGLFRLSAAERGSLRGSYLGLGRLIYYLRPGAAASRTEGSPFRFGLSLESGRTWSRSEDVDAGDLLMGGTAFVAVDTPIGPIHAGWALLDDRPPGWFFRVGPTH